MFFNLFECGLCLINFFLSRPSKFRTCLEGWRGKTELSSISERHGKIASSWYTNMTRSFFSKVHRTQVARLKYLRIKFSNFWAVNEMIAKQLLRYLWYDYQLVFLFSGSLIKMLTKFPPQRISIFP